MEKSYTFLAFSLFNLEGKGVNDKADEVIVGAANLLSKHIRDEPFMFSLSKCTLIILFAHILVSLLTWSIFRDKGSKR